MSEVPLYTCPPPPAPPATIQKWMQRPLHASLKLIIVGEHGCYVRLCDGAPEFEALQHRLDARPLPGRECLERLFRGNEDQRSSAKSCFAEMRTSGVTPPCFPPHGSIAGWPCGEPEGA
jgi:hypothetical protein